MQSAFAPLLAASPAIQVHAFAAMAAFVLGLVQIFGPKGTLPHRTLGWIWVTLMKVVAVSAFFIHEVRTWGLFSPIHLLSVYTLATLPPSILYARRRNVAAHRRAMIGMFCGALLVAGALTLLPGRIMHAVLFGS